MQIPFKIKHINIYLFFCLIGLLFFYPMLHRIELIAVIFDLFVFFVVITSILAVSKRLSHVIVISLFGLVMLATTFLGNNDPGSWLAIASTVFGMIFFSLIIVVLAKDIYTKNSRVTWNSIFGAIDIYLLVGLLFSYIYFLIFLIEPTAIETAYPIQKNNDYAFTVLNYFSFVTLTTLGYGDVTPKLIEVGVITNLQAIIGQVYLVVMVARLVSLHVAQE